RVLLDFPDSGGKSSSDRLSRPDMEGKKKTSDQLSLIQSSTLVDPIINSPTLVDHNLLSSTLVDPIINSR
ncbi:hypothetical protein ISN45_At01g019650, partial [Arabidopsis thaliana x Arabidopsis arenosa]